MTVELKCGSLFSGIGGGDLGLQRAGFKIAWQVEVDEWCRRVLTKHWPDVPKHRDVREVGKHNLEWVHLIHGGFPCTDISIAGRRAGLDGEHSGLWAEFARVVGELRPHFVLVENSTALIVRGLGRVLGDLASLGFDAEWECIPAAAVGAPHLRARLWILAYPAGFGDRIPEGAILPRRGSSLNSDWWASEPGVCRVDARPAYRLDRLRGLGNAEVPQVVEWLGKRIMTSASAPSAVDAERTGE